MANFSYVPGLSPLDDYTHAISAKKDLDGLGINQSINEVVNGLSDAGNSAHYDNVVSPVIGILGSPTASNPGDETPSSAFDYSLEASEIYQAVKRATELQNQASQASADRAMEFSEEQARIAREFNASQAQKAMDYQTEMFGKRYQMTMEDLRKAGLNPKLVGSLGSPSAPSGVAASASAPEGINANMSMQNISAVAGVLETYMTNVNALDRNENDFVKAILTTLLGALIPGVQYLHKV